MHNLTIREDGTTEMFSAVTTPWHGLGVRLDHAATAEEAIVAAALDWNIVTEKLFDHRGDALKDYQLIRRPDTQRVLGVCGSRWVPVQNIEAFDFMDNLLDRFHIEYHTAGSLAGGRYVWVLAKFKGLLQVAGDVVEKYLLLYSPHTGHDALTLRFTPVRVVCQNTLAVALRQSDRVFRAHHTPNVHSRLDEARRVLDLSDLYFEIFQEQASELVKATIDRDSVLTEYFGPVLEVKPETYDKSLALATVKEIFAGGDNLWLAYNAVTEYLDHHKPLHRDRQTVSLKVPRITDKRLTGSWIGPGVQLRQRAWDTALQLAGVA